VRQLATRHIDAGELPSSTTLTSLGQSIAAHGMLQPLLVRRAGTRYQLISGRRRLAAALASGITEVPCIVHEVSESAAQAIAESERAAASAVEPLAATAGAGPRSVRLAIIVWPCGTTATGPDAAGSFAPDIPGRSGVPRVRAELPGSST